MENCKFNRYIERQRRAINVQHYTFVTQLFCVSGRNPLTALHRSEAEISVIILAHALPYSADAMKVTYTLSSFL